MAAKSTAKKTTAKKTTAKATTKKTTKSTSAKKKTAAKQAMPQEYSTIIDEVVILITLAFCVIWIISNFGIGGTVGGAVSSFFFGIFGVMAYLMPLLVFAGIAFLVSNKHNMTAYLKTLAGFVFVILICSFLELVFNLYDKNASLMSYYTNASIHKNAGGLLGGCIVKLLCPLVGVVGAFVVIIILGIICFVLISGKSFIGSVSHGSKMAYDDAKRRKAISNEKKAERARVNQEENRKKAANGKAASGVSFNTTLSKKSPDIKELEAPGGETASPLTEEIISDETKVMSLENLVINRAEPVLDLDEAFTETASEKTMEQDIEEIKPQKARKTAESAAMVAEETASVEQTILSTQKPVAPPYKCPPMNLLVRGKKTGGDSDAHLRATALKLERTLQTFGVNVHVTNASCGPSVTRYELQPELGVKVSKIVGLADDIKLNLAVADLRIEAPIPGKAAVGIEVPNQETKPVMLRDLLESDEFKNSSAKIAFAAGKDISGKTVIADIAKMPHLLVAGATGSGKSVCINTLIMSILYRSRPEDVKLIMIDPKVVELSVYNGIPHLLIPVVTDPKKAAGALNWAVAEMTKRYQLFAEYNVRDLKGFNEKISSMNQEDGVPEKMPQIVIIVDELADLMMVAPGEVEGAICRLAQLARAAGLHLILATQRPSVNVITGLIKANMPSRIAFSVSSGVDSRTIIDMNGAEKLLGKGDMLFYPTGYPKPVRVQGSFVSDKEVQKVVDYLIERNGTASYNEEITNHVNSNAAGTGNAVQGGDENERDTYFVEAGRFIIEKEKASIGMLQRVFKIGFNRAARIMDQLCEAGVVGEEEGTKPRKVLMSKEEFEQYIEEYV
ncbi:MAG: DNA translocase FtsK [Hespellia sp.]|nr:DNA translocase FtsK [Hespellia sp.]